MNTDLISYLVDEVVEEKTAAVLREKAMLEQEKAQLEAQLRTALQQAVEDAIAAHFPNAPLTLTCKLRQIASPATLQELLRVVLIAPDLATIERFIKNAGNV